MSSFLKYLRLLPLLSLFDDIVGFIRDAEAIYKAPGSGAQKLTDVLGKLVPLVTEIAKTGLIPQKLADAIVTGAPAIVSLIVQIMNLTGGVTPVQVPVPTPAPASNQYDTLDAAKAAASAAGPFNAVAQVSGDPHFYVVDNRSVLPSGWQVIWP